MTDIFKLQPIGEKVFNLLGDEDLLICRLVSKTWKSALDEPMFWLKKLQSIGHSEQAQNQWLDLIQKCLQTNKPKQILTLSIMLKYYSIPEILEDKGNLAFRKVLLNFPPIFTAAKYGHLEVVKLIHLLDTGFNRPVSYEPSSDNFFIPLNLAIKNCHMEVVKYIVDNLEVRSVPFPKQ